MRSLDFRFTFVESRNDFDWHCRRSHEKAWPPQGANALAGVGDDHRPMVKDRVREDSQLFAQSLRLHGDVCSHLRWAVGGDIVDIYALDQNSSADPEALIS